MESLSFSDAPPWYQWALHELGVREIPENRGPDIRRYISLAHAGGEGDPWCAIFVNAAFEACDIAGTRSASSQSFRDSHSFLQLGGPALGAVSVFWRHSRHSGLGHVGFYRGERGGYVWALGGNESDMVQIEAFPKIGNTFGLIGYWWPRSVALPQHVGPILVAADTPAHQTKVT